MRCKQNMESNSERGSALLLTLGILSLVLIMAMGFCYSANTSLRVAKVQGGSNDARSIVDSAVDNLLVDMEFVFAPDKSYTGMTGLYPSHELNTDITPSTLGYNQSLINFQKKELEDPSKTNDEYSASQNYFYSVNPSSTPTADESGYVGALLGLGKYGKPGEGTWFTSDDLTQDKKILKELPALKFMLTGKNPVPSSNSKTAMVFNNKLGFAPSITMQSNIPNRPTDEVIGRYAYIALEDANKININGIISLTGRGPQAIDRNNLSVGGSDYDRLANRFDIDKFSTSPSFKFNIFDGGFKNAVYTEEDTVRLGLLPEELEASVTYLDELYKSSGASMGWMSYRHMWDVLPASPAAGTLYYQPSNNSDRGGMGDVFLYTFFGLEDQEAYLSGSDADPMADRKMIVRWDLTGLSWGLSTPLTGSTEIGNIDTATSGFGRDTAWDTTTLAKGRELVQRLCYGETVSDLSQTLTVNSANQLTFWANEDKRELNYLSNGWTNGKGYIDWLHRMVATVSATLEDGVAGTPVGLQVAANIKDYSDHDNEATYETKDNKLTPTAGKPFPQIYYCGNERVQYINEVLFRGGVDSVLKPKPTLEADGTQANYYEYTVDLYAAAELVNIYSVSDADIVEPGEVTIAARVKLKVMQQEYVKDENGVYQPKADALIDLKTTHPKLEPLSANGDQLNYIEFKTKDSDPKAFVQYWKGNSSGKYTDSAFVKNKIGYNAFYAKKTLELSDDMTKLILDSNEKYRYIFLFEITDVQVITHDTNTVVHPQVAPGAVSDESEIKIFDIALMPSGNNEYTNDIPENYIVPESNHSDFLDLDNIVVFQCTDPRANHLASSWIAKSKDNATADSINRDNDCLSASGDGVDADKEPSISFAAEKSYSTAYIRNAPMQSLTELGAIHRGAPGQTINLKKFCDTPATVNYADGDAGLLDQVKIGPLMFVKGRVNSNQLNPQVWKMLLSDCDIVNTHFYWYDLWKVKDRPKEEVPWLAKFNRENAEIKKENLIQGIKTVADSWNKTPSGGSGAPSIVLGKPSASRVKILTEILQNSGLSASNDRDYESFIGRTAQLLTSRADAYTILLAAESLESLDIDAVTFNAVSETTFSNPVKIEQIPGGSTFDYYSVTGRQKVLLHVIRDAWKNTFKVVGKRYLED